MTTARGRSILWFGAVCAVLLVVAVAMRLVAVQSIAPYVPLWADQVQYLTEAYRGYDLIREHGLIAGTIAAVRQPRPQGWLLQTVASLHMLGVGPGRVGALDLNLVLLLVWLGTTSYAVKRAFGISASLVALGLTLSTAFVLNHPGGPFDFRLDFAATCLWGALIPLVAIADGRFRWGTGAAILLLGSALILTRFISTFYLLPFGALVTLLAIVTRWTDRSGWRRWWFWMIPVVAAWAVLSGLVIALNYDVFQSYYVRGHLTGGEVTVRRVAAGLQTSWDDLAFYPRTVVGHHLTRSFHGPAILLLILSLASGLLLWRSSGWTGIWPWKGVQPSARAAVAAPRGPSVWFLGVAVLGLLAVYLTLTLAQQKSPVVAGPFIPPIVLLVVGTGVWLSRASWDVHPLPLARLGFRLLGPVTIVVALGGHWRQFEPGRLGLPPLPVLQTYAQIIDDATPYLVERRGRPIRWSMDWHHVEIAAQTVQVATYERTGQWVTLAAGLGHGAVEEQLDAAQVLEEARASDVLLLSERPPGTRMSFPNDQSVQDHHHVLERYAEETLTLLNRYEIQGTPYFLYVRPHPRDRQ